MKLLKIAIISIALAACKSGPQLPDPTIVLPEPPPELMVPPEDLETIEEEPNGRSEIST